MPSTKCKLITKNIAITLSCIILSPVLIVVAIVGLTLYELVVVIQVIKNTFILAKFARKRRSYIQKDINALTVTQMLTFNQIMFVFKPMPGLDLFLSIQDGKLSIMDKNLNNLASKQIQFTFTPGEQQKFCYLIYYDKLFKSEVSECTRFVPPGYLNTPLFLNGRVFFNVFDFVFELLPSMEVRLLQQLPAFFKYHRRSKNLDLHAGQMFSINKQLYLQNNSTKLFTLNERLKCVDHKHSNTHYYQFCDKVYAITDLGIFRVSSTLQLILIQRTNRVQVVFSSGGLLVLKNTHVKWDGQQLEVLILNMLDGKMCKQIDFTLQMTLGKAGLQLNSDIILELCGPNFESEVTQYQTKWLSQNEINKFSSGFLKLILSGNINQILNESFFKNQIGFERGVQTVRSGQKRVMEAIQGIGAKIQQMISTFSYFGTENGDQ
ncbi:Hypothetical_protein [Hexamita inflata]|uniref:Hypothetical_protein n=1 Tax=Hexamita inflata TaxID=28002 RepID=A0AA86PB81_9EUKA|nr:Hypothetical protein HINF_LOCUS22978 [Hexamita inflata]CAI9946992.1 Hypothetical protein HINF_LOCUS34637 [Hexamita inflata]